MRDILIAAYLDYKNNYLTVEKYAEHNGLSYEQAMQLILVAISVFNSKHPEA